MKRSDMIQKIVYEALSWSGLDTSGVPLEEIANDVLTVCENEGMIPPMTNETENAPGGFVRLWTMKWSPETEKSENSHEEK